MAADLSALNNMGPADRSKLMQTVREQVAIQNFQQLYEKMVDKCFQKCVPKPSTDLDRYEKRCLEMCMDRLAMAVPESMKVLQPFLKVAEEFRGRDPVISYYTMLYLVQRGIKLPGSKEKAGKTFLLQKMNELESLKAAVSTREEVAEETVGQAHVETGAIKLFSWADDQDRNCNFGKAVIKAFYTASSIFETLRQFGDLSLEVEEKMKYAKVKAVYLSTCLKTGETPVPGNPAEDPVPLPPVPPAQDPTPTSVASPAPGLADTSEESSQETPIASTSGAPIPTDLLARSEEHVKFAASALQYQDVNTAVTFLQRALSILTSGHDIPN